MQKNKRATAIVLCAGFGTRLRSIAGDTPKVMVPINGKPFLVYVLSYLENQGIQEVVLAVGYKKEVIQNYFGDTFGSLHITYSLEDEPHGTGTTMRKAFEMIEDSAFVLNGDTLFAANLETLEQTYTEHNADIVLALKELTNFDRYGAVDLNNGRIVGFEEKKLVSKGLINGGIYYLSKKVFEKIDTPEHCSFEKDVLEKYVDTLNIRGEVFDGYFIDIGIPEDYARAQQEIT